MLSPGNFLQCEWNGPTRFILLTMHRRDWISGILSFQGYYHFPLRIWNEKASHNFKRNGSWVLSGFGGGGSLVVFKRSPPFCRRSPPVSSQKPFWWTLAPVQEGCANIVSIDSRHEDEKWEIYFCLPPNVLARNVMHSWRLRGHPKENCLKSSGTKATYKGWVQGSYGKLEKT